MKRRTELLPSQCKQQKRPKTPLHISCLLLSGTPLSSFMALSICPIHPFSKVDPSKEAKEAEERKAAERKEAASLKEAKERKADEEPKKREAIGSTTLLIALAVCLFSAMVNCHVFPSAFKPFLGRMSIYYQSLGAIR